jgi:hypothetical protein
MDNAAFEDPRELGRILSAIAAKIRKDSKADAGPAIDINGNNVGEWTIYGERE